MPILLLLLLVFSVGTAHGRPLQLSLKESIAMALEHNHRVKAASFVSTAAGQAPAIAAADYYPRLSVREDFAISNSPTRTFMMKLDQGRFSQDDFRTERLNHPSSQHDFSTALMAEMPLYLPSTAPLTELAAREADRAGLALEATRQEIAFEVFRLYLEAYRHRAQVVAAEQAVTEGRESLRLARVRQEAGTGLKADELRARTHLSAVEQQLITAHSDLTLALLRFSSVLGVPRGTRVDPDLVLPSLTLDRPPEELVRAAQVERVDMRLSRTAQDLSEAALKLARSAYLPTVSALAGYRINSREIPFGVDNDSWSAGLQLTWQLFDGFRRQGEVRRAVAERSAAAELVSENSREANYRVQEGLLRHEEMGKRLEVARHAVLDAEETVRLLAQRFENSLATMLELLDSQTMLNQARASLAAAEADYVLAKGRILQASGLFLKEMQR